MINSRRLYETCFHAAVAASQAFIAVVAGGLPWLSRFRPARRGRSSGVLTNPIQLSGFIIADELGERGFVQVRKYFLSFSLSAQCGAKLP
jgi:hypothetical protein